MMKVFAVICCYGPEGYDVPDAVFSTRDLAEAYRRAARDDHPFAETIELIEYELDQVKP